MPKGSHRKRQVAVDPDESETEGDSDDEVEREPSTSVRLCSKPVKMSTKKGKLREELSTLPLGDLLSLKDHMPAKIYNKAVFGGSSAYDESSDINSPDTADYEKSSNETSAMVTNADKRPQFKRDNRKRPREMSAKKPVSVLRDVFVTKKRVVRDPRFDDASGQFSAFTFHREYSFLKDIKETEYKALRKEIKEEEDPDRLAQLKRLKLRLDNQRKSEEEEKKKLEIKRQARSINTERMKQGKQPFYIKQGEIKRKIQDERLEKLEKAGKLAKYQERKEKKLAGKKNTVAKR